MEAKVNCITINTDASFSLKHKVGGYAFYIVCDLFKIQESGNFKVEPKTPEEAEIMAIGNAIARLISKGESLPKCNHLIINNDCTWGQRRIEKGETELARKVLKLKKTLVFKLGKPKNEFRYVKAHNGGCYKLYAKIKLESKHKTSAYSL